jgi:hypothetical protein
MEMCVSPSFVIVFKCFWGVKAVQRIIPRGKTRGEDYERSVNTTMEEA